MAEQLNQFQWGKSSPIVPLGAIVPSLAIALSLLVSCSHGSNPEPGAESDEIAQLWALADLEEVWSQGTRAVGKTEQREFKQAVEVWDKVLEKVPFWYTARINRAIALFAGNEFEPSRREYERVLAAFESNPWAHYGLGLLDARDGRWEPAAAHFEAVIAIDPSEPDSHWQLGEAQSLAGRLEQAVHSLEQAVELDPNHGAAWYALANVRAELGLDEESQQARETHARLKESGKATPRADRYGRQGFYAMALRPENWEIPRPAAAGDASGLSVFFSDGSEDAGFDLPSLKHGGSGSTDISTWGVLPDALAEMSGGISAVDMDIDGSMDLVLAHWGRGPEARILLSDGAGSFADASSDYGLDTGLPAQTVALATADFDGDALPDLFLGRASADRALARPMDEDRGTFERELDGFEDAVEETYSVAVGDIDQDGDLDLFLGRAGGVALYRWEGGGFADVTRESGFLSGAPCLSVLLTDVDGDQDVDLVAGTPQPSVWLNDRMWRFRVGVLPGVSEREVPFGSVGLADLNADLEVDWAMANPIGASELLVAQESGGYVAEPAFAATAPGSAFSIHCSDFDRDGDQDALVVGPKPALLLRQNDGTWLDASAASGLDELAPLFAQSRGSVLLDADGDGDLDLALVRNGASPLLLRNDTAAGGSWIAVLAQGIADPSAARGKSLGHGSRMELIHGARTHVNMAGLGGGFASVAPVQMHVNLPNTQNADFRIQWADLKVQSEFDLTPETLHEIEQVDREDASCPVLFYWNGSEMAYRTDFLGGGGLGFLIEPGSYGPPDRDEVVWIGSDLEARAGNYELIINEPMEEVTYLDRVELVAVEHPAGTSVLPDERFVTGGVAATGRALVYRERERAFASSAIVRELPVAHENRYLDEVNGKRVRDVQGALLEVDRDFTGPGRPHRRLLGYAAPWALELEFDPQQLVATSGESEALLLVLHGWVEYPYSRLNLAANQEGLGLETFSLEVETEPGQWERVLDQFGYMAGKERAMAIDVAPYLNDRIGKRGDHIGKRGLRVRLVSNIVCYLDQLFLVRERAVDRRNLTVHGAPASAAELAHGGYPKDYLPDGKKPHRYDYSARSDMSDFKRLQGRYTQFGDVLELLEEGDDRFAIFGNGEEVRLRFATGDFPLPQAGKRRTWLLATEGWCKDMCPLTAEPTTVEPLPYGAMGNYPPQVDLGVQHPAVQVPINSRVLNQD